MSSQQRRESMIALKARSKAFRIALDFVHPRLYHLRQSEFRCECGGELRLTDPDHGLFRCQMCDRSVEIPIDVETPVDSWVLEQALSRRRRRWNQFAAWALLLLLLWVTFLLALKFLNLDTVTTLPQRTTTTTAPATQQQGSP